MEIDFVFQNIDEVMLIEIRAKDGRTNSASEILKNKEKYKDVKKLIRFKNSNVGSTDNIDTYPLYMEFLL